MKSFDSPVWAFGPFHSQKNKKCLVKLFFTQG